MAQTHRRIAVAGASGRVGRHTADILEERGHDVVPISRSHGVDVITGEGLAAALVGVESVIDATSGPSPEQHAATEFFRTATRNLQDAGKSAGVSRIVVVSIIGLDHFTAGYGVAKQVHEHLMMTGPIPTQVLRALQFHEFVEQMMQWGRQGDVAYLPKMRTQLVAARTVAEALADMVLAPVPETPPAAVPEIAGPREENLVDMAILLAERRGDPVTIEGRGNPDDPDDHLYEAGALLPGPHATLAGPTFEEWLDQG